MERQVRIIILISFLYSFIEFLILYRHWTCKTTASLGKSSVKWLGNSRHPVLRRALTLTLMLRQWIEGRWAHQTFIGNRRHTTAEQGDITFSEWDNSIQMTCYTWRRKASDKHNPVWNSFSLGLGTREQRYCNRLYPNGIPDIAGSGRIRLLLFTARNSL
jgi:hypothetical protein